MNDDTSKYEFEVTGGFNVRNNLVISEAYDESVVGFELPDGRIVKPCVALEVESTDGKAYRYITSEKEMEELGFDGLDYDNIQFFALPTE